MIKINGREMLAEDGSVIRLRGVNLGNWMLIEPNMFGTVGTQRRTRQAMEAVAGKEKTDLFFQGLLNKWITEKDICYLKGLGFNSVRVPMHYRYFESGEVPFRYKEEGFAQLDRILDYCRKYEMYMILDLHAAQGCQSGDWHCDNIFQERTELYYDRTAQDRFCALWEEFAERYKTEKWIAGYDLMNEPVAESPYEVEQLNQLYIRAIKKIRRIDTEHIIFLEGNQWSQVFEPLMHESFGENIAYSPHYYCDAAVQEWDYPGEGGSLSGMRAAMDSRDHWIYRKGVPCWVGEFGVRRLGNPEGKNTALEDYLTVFEERDESWCYWNFKDLRVRGPLYLKKDSPWCQFVGEFEKIKRRYCTDRSLPVSERWNFDFIFEQFEEGDFCRKKDEVYELLVRNVRETLADQLTWTFAKKFAALTSSEIEALTDSFLFENCERYEPWEDIFRKYCCK